MELRAIVERYFEKSNEAKNILKKYEDIQIELDKREVYVNGKLVELGNKEFQILVYLIENNENVISREKLLEKGRWTYKLIIKKTPISTQSIENAPCLVCPVEQKCTLDGEISPRNCQFIEDWVIAEMKKPSKSK